MITKDQHENMKSLAIKLGLTTQINQFQEEVGEALTAINKCNRERGIGLPLKLSERGISHESSLKNELVDVILTAYEVLYAMNTSDTEINNMMEYKINRTIQAISGLK